ncbi:MAG: hypothetical protein D6820_07205 [Lentisphaerae bacterium]|nr:MAG: hypothetical protein D6820_07205 [Lentisphaerota bacterium]
MKSAFEKALERFGPLEEIDEETKAKLAEIDRIYDARKAEIELKYTPLLAQAASPDERDRLLAERADALKQVEVKREEEKEKVRNARS